MAKKQTPPETEKDFFDEYKAGTRKCVHCLKYTKGPKAPKCKNPACGKDFPPLAQTEKAVKGANPPAMPSVGLSDALKQADKVKEFVGEHGGYDEAMQVVDAFDSLIKDCGGIAQLKGAITTLKKWENK